MPVSKLNTISFIVVSCISVFKFVSFMFRFVMSIFLMLKGMGWSWILS